MALMYTIVSIIQVFAISYLLKVSIEGGRSLTFSKNFLWVKENTEFLQKYRRPSIVPLVLFALGAIVLLIVFGVVGSELLIWKTKLISIIVMTLGSILISKWQEKQLEKDIPLRSERTASFEKQSILNYVHPVLFRGSGVLAIGTIAFTVISFVNGTISVELFASDMVMQIILYALLVWTFFAILKEKVPHGKDSQLITKEDVSKNYKIFSIRLTVGMFYFISILMITMVGFQLNGIVLYENPLLIKVSSWFGGADSMEYLFSRYQWDLVMSVMSVPFFIGMARSKSLRDTRSTILLK